MKTITITEDTYQTALDIELSEELSFMSWLKESIGSTFRIYNIWHCDDLNEDFATVDLCVEIPVRGSILSDGEI